MRYCGHLYSLLLRKCTCLDQRDQVFYCMGRGLILEPTGSLSCDLVECTGVGPLLCGVGSCEMHKNDQATIKTRYCGHLYSLLLRKWTRLDQTDRVFYCMGRGLILEPTGSLSCDLVGCMGVGPLLCGWV